jgi:hypothetical protein
MLYLIPAGRSSTVLIGNYYLVKSLIGTKARRILDIDMSFDSESPMAAITQGRVPHKRMFAYQEYFNPYPPFESVAFRNEVSFADDSGASGSFTFDVGNGVIEVSWQAETDGAYGEFPDVWRYISTTDPNSFTRMSTSWDYRRTYRFEPTEAGAVRLAEVPGDALTNIELRAVDPIDEGLGHWWETILLLCKDMMSDYLNRMLKLFVDTTSEIEMLRLHGLLFRSDVVVNLRSVHFPCDLAAFGELAPGMTAFSVDPLEQVLAAGSSIAMKTVPEQATVKWSVESVTGFAGDIGSISETGVYKAPDAHEIDGLYTMVRVSASTATAKSSALLRIVRRSVLINPLVVTASNTSGKIQMSAGAVDGGELAWTISSATGAEITDTPPVEGQYDQGERFYVPGPGSSGYPFSVDEVTVTNPRTNDSHTGYVLRIEQTLGGRITTVSDSLPAGKVRLIFDNNLGPLEGTTWTVIAGGGAVDADGIYTVDEDSPHPFVIITAYFLVPNVIELVNFVILPIPLVDLGEDKARD